VTPPPDGPDDLERPDLEALVRGAVADIAPEVGADAVDADADFHDDLGLDSMDALNLAIALHEATGVDIPERDYPEITSIATCVEYLRAHGAT
jgi:acyl carrier protein